jgi:hemoglobin
MENRSLFNRLGGSSGIRAIVDDIVEAHMVNPAIRARFLPYRETPDRIEIVKKHLCAFLEEGGGGPSKYTGRTMRDTHRGMNLCEREYMAAIDDILGVLQKHSIDDQTQKDVLHIAYSLKGEIMHL